MNINSIDLNLLKAFDAMYRERHVGRAAESIALAQSSMSNALNRLRDQFHDPLFQRTQDGMQPTARADELAPLVSQVFENVAEMLSPMSFDPLSLKANVVIAASDLSVMTEAPKLIPLLREQAPGVQLNFVPLDKQEIFSQLDKEIIDLVLGTFSRVPARFHRKVISNEKFLCITRKGHPDIGGQLTLEGFAELSHILMTLNKDNIGVIDKALKKLGKQRNIAMTCAQFSPLLEVVINSDLIATVPSTMKSVALRAGCDIYPLPFDMPDWETELIATQRFFSSPLGRFISELF